MKWITLLAEGEKDVLVSAQCVDQNKLIIVYMHDVKVLEKICFLSRILLYSIFWQSTLQVHDLDTGKLLRKFPLEMGEVSVSGDKKYSDIFYQFDSFLTPGTTCIRSCIYFLINNTV